MCLSLLIGGITLAAVGKMSLSVVKFLVKVRCRTCALSSELVNSEPSLSLSGLTAVLLHSLL
jgi:hypothetical protein